MPQGFRKNLLKSQESLFRNPSLVPDFQLEHLGNLTMLKNQKGIRLDSSAGHKNVVDIAYYKRFTVDFTDTAKSCDQVNQTGKEEVQVDVSNIRQIAIHLPDETLARYEDEASRTAFGDASAELMTQVRSAANAILQGVDRDLLTLQVAAVGTNRNTGSNAAKAINLNKDGQTNELNDGVTEILIDYKTNGGSGRPQIIGSGLFHNYTMQQAFMGRNSFGLDTKIQASAYDFYFDIEAATQIGANQCIVYQPDAVQLVEYMEYTGFKAGDKPDGSSFGTLMLPMIMNDRVVPIEFDYQLKYNSCPETVTDAYYGTSLTLEKGYNIIISKRFGLHTIPATAYRGTDPMTGNRGSLRYSFTNNCETCS